MCVGLEHLQSGPDVEFADEFRSLAFAALDRQVRRLQVVHFWRIRGDGKMLDIALPLLDTVDTCCAYVLGLALLDRHHLQRGIKRCRLMAKIPRGDRQRHKYQLWHWFINLPIANNCIAAHDMRMPAASVANVLEPLLNGECTSESRDLFPLLY